MAGFEGRTAVLSCESVGKILLQAAVGKVIALNFLCCTLYRETCGIFGKNLVTLRDATFYPGSCQKFSSSFLLLITSQDL